MIRLSIDTLALASIPPFARLAHRHTLSHSFTPDHIYSGHRCYTMAKRKTTICPQCGRSVLADRLDAHQKRYHDDTDADEQDRKSRSWSKRYRNEYDRDGKSSGDRREIELVRSVRRGRVAFTVVIIVAAIVLLAVINPYGLLSFGGDDGSGDGDDNWYSNGGSNGGSNSGSNGGSNGDVDDGSVPDPATSSNRYAQVKTTEGTILFELYEERAPTTTANFIRYANDGFYDGLIFHRVIDGFMVQGGGFEPDMTKKTPTYDPIPLETHPELGHVDGAVAMARTNDPNSATSQFFIDDGAQPHLEPSESSDGYAVFGQVVSGMNVVRAISAVETHTDGGHQDVPVEDIVIQSVSIVDNP